jgi:diadenosine tetraphosphate (Ap4A) HIT family hydrolase
MSCIFCEILARRAPGSFVGEDEACAAFMDIMPVSPGHVLVVPRRHAANLAGLDPQDGSQLFQMAQKISLALPQAGIRCEGVNLFLADGAAAGQEVFHVHLHVIPRYAGDGFGFRFGPNYGKESPRASLDELAERIRSGLRLGGAH